MKVIFKNGTSVRCSAPTEQRVNNNVGGTWILVLTLYDISTSDEFEELMVSENISELNFFDENADVSKSSPLYTINGYCRINSAVIRHDTEQKCDIQLVKAMEG